MPSEYRELQRQVERLQTRMDIVAPVGTIPDGPYAPRDKQFVVMGTGDTDLTMERALTAGDGITRVDGGANSTVTLAVDGTVVRTTRTVTAGAGLTGGGALSGDITLAVATADTSITVNADSIQVALAAASGLAVSSGLMIDDAIAGAGLAIASKVLAVGAGNGLTVNANDVALTTPGTLTVSSTNAAAGSHTHAITSSANPGADVESILASDAAGYLQLIGLGIGTAALADNTLRLADAGTINWSDIALSRVGANILGLASGDALESTYTAGWAGSGYHFDYNQSYANEAFLELDRLSVRGIMNVYELLIHQIRATNGSIFVTNTGKAKVATANGGASYTIETETDHGFAVNDLIRAQRFTGTGTYQCDMTVTAVADTTHFTANLRATYTAPAIGMEFVRLGNTTDTDRQGSIYLTADDTGAPYINILADVAAFTDWGTTGKTRGRIGNMYGAYGTGNNHRYGGGFGDYDAGNYLKYDEVGGFEIAFGGGRDFIDGDGLSLTVDSATTQPYQSIKFVNGANTIAILRAVYDSATGDAALYSVAKGTDATCVAENVMVVSKSDDTNYTGFYAYYDAATDTGWCPVYVEDTEVLRFNQASIVTYVDLTTTALNVNTTGAAAGQGFFAGSIMIGDTANAKSTLGLTINQGAADDEILSFKSSDVAHGVTDITETDAFAYFSKYGAMAGGLRITGIAEGATGMALMPIHTTDVTTKATDSDGVLNLDCYLKSGTGTASPGANANLVVIRAAATTRFIFDVEGSAHADVEWIAFDRYDDLQALDSLQVLAAGTAPRLTPERYGVNSLAYSREQFEAMGIIGKDSWHEEDGQLRAMVNFTRLAMLHHGAILQTVDRVLTVEERLGAIERKLLAN